MAASYIERARGLFSSAATRYWLSHAARTALAAVASLIVARLCRMPEAYWAPITTIIVMQSTLGAAWAASKQRLIGTALGAAAGAMVASYFDRGIIVFGVAIFALGLLCAILRLDQSAYRFAGVTLTIIVLIARPQEAWITGLHRFVEVSLGIAVALIFTAVWPPQDLPSAKNAHQPSS
jgi:uncharacterized membrane protein YgaE (UPF0421/DUF939 family)